MKKAPLEGIAHAKANKPESCKGRKPSYTAAQIRLIMQRFTGVMALIRKPEMLGRTSWVFKG